MACNPFFVCEPFLFSFFRLFLTFLSISASLHFPKSGAPPTEVGVTKAPASAKPAEAHPPALIMLAINAAIRRIANTASADTLSAFIRRYFGVFIRQLKLAAF